MTAKEFKTWNQKAIAGEVADELNPAFLLNSTHNDLLVQIAAGKIDLKALAKHVLDSRGYDRDGNWVGFRTK